MISKKFGTLFQFEPKSNIKAGAGLDKGKYPFYTSSTIQTKRIDVAQYKGNSIVIGTGGQPSVHYAPTPFSTSTDCFVVIPKTKEINSQYVYYFFKGNMHILQKGFRGAGLKHISKGYIDKIDIPIISLEEQNRIVWVLDKTEKLICQRKQSIETLEALIKSVFLEMFGDPKNNSSGWALSTIKDRFGRVVTGNTPPRENKGYYAPRFIEWIKTDNVSNQLFVSTANEYLSREGAAIGRIVEKDALLVTCIAGSLNSIGNAALTDRRVAFNQQINAIIPNKDTEPLFLYYLFKYSKKYIQTFARNGLKLIITKRAFEKIKLIDPPQLLQKKFVRIAEKLCEQKVNFELSVTILDELFQSLLQKAFRGELVLNNSEYSFQKAIADLNWFEKQLQAMQPYGFSSETIKVLAEIQHDRWMEAIEDLSEALKENHLPEIGEIIDLEELLYSFGVTLLCEVDDQEQIQQLISHPALRHTNIDLAFNKLLEERKLEREKVNQEIIKENDQTLRFMNRTLFQEMPFGDEQVNLARFIHESFQDKEFTVSGIMERLRAKQALKGKKASEIKNDVFALIQKFIKTEFVDLPFTFQELYRRLREKLFCPSFDLLHEFVVIELDRKPGLLQMYYPGDMANQFPKHFQHLQNEKASNKLYLIATYGNSQD